MLKQIIKSSGQTQSLWAKRLQISEPYLSDLLAGRKDPSLKVAVRIERETHGAVLASSWIPEAVPTASTADPALGVACHE